MKILFSFLFLLTAYTLVGQPKPQQEEWLRLFNGKNLNGWTPKISGYPAGDNYGQTFRAENGMLRIVYDQARYYPSFDKRYGHLYYKTPFSHYRLRFTYRFQGEQVPGGDTWNVRNSGVMIHSQSAESNGLQQGFPVSLEVQLLGGLGKGPRHTANLCTPGTQVYINGNPNPAHCIDSRSKTYDGDQWVTVEVLVLGDLVKHFIDGQEVLAYDHAEVSSWYLTPGDHWDKDAKAKDPAYWASRANTPLREGYIALQSESHAIDFKDIELLNLKGCMNPNALNYKAYYRASEPSQCRFSAKKPKTK